MSYESHSEGIEGTRYLKFTNYFSNREKKIMKEMFGEEYPTYDLTDRDIMRILGRVRQSARTRINPTQIVNHFKRHYYLLTDSEVADILDPALTPQEQTLRLIDYLVFKGSYGLGCLYFSLVETSEEMYGLPTHFQLACELKKAIIEGSCIHDYSLTAEAVSGGQETKEAVDDLISQLDGVVVSPGEARSLAVALGIQLHSAVMDLKEVCSVWRKKRSAVCTVEDLVEALVLTRNLGRHTARLCRPGPHHTISLHLKAFFHGLGIRWLNIAYYLGYTEDEVSAIVEGEADEDSCERQVSAFLEEWQMPDCGARTVTILQKLKLAAKVPDSGRLAPSSRKLAKASPAVRLDACERPYYSQSMLPSSSSSSSSSLYPSSSALALETTPGSSSYPTERTLLVYQPGYDDSEAPGRLYLFSAKYYPTDTDNYDTSGKYDNTSGPQIEELPSSSVSNTAEYRDEQLKALLASASEAKSKSSEPKPKSGGATTRPASGEQLSRQLSKSDSIPDSIPPSNSLQNGSHSLSQSEISSSKSREGTSPLPLSFVSQAVPVEDSSSERPSMVSAVTLTDSSRHSSLTSFSLSQPETHASHELASQLVPAEGEHQLASISGQASFASSASAASSLVVPPLSAAKSLSTSSQAESSASALVDSTRTSQPHPPEPVLATCSSSDDHRLSVTPKTVVMMDGLHDQPSSARPTAISLDSMRCRGLEILHDFTQYLIAAALKRNKIEDVISAAEKRGHTELVGFFYQYFYDTTLHSGGGELVSAFLKGLPSPMMFLILERLVTREDFESLLEEYGLKDFPDQLAMAFHQVSESADSLPWTGSELLEAMFVEGTVFAGVSSSVGVGSGTGIPPELLQQLLSQRRLTLRQPDAVIPQATSLPASTPVPSQPPPTSKPQEAKESVAVVSRSSFSAPTEPSDASSHQKFASPSSDRESVTNDLNFLDVMDDDAAPTGALNSFAEEQVLNVWDTEVVEAADVHVDVASSEAEPSRSQPNQLLTTDHTTAPHTPVTATTNAAATSATPTATPSSGVSSSLATPTAAPTSSHPPVPTTNTATTSATPTSLATPTTAATSSHPPTPSSTTGTWSDIAEGALRERNARNSQLSNMAAADTGGSVTEVNPDTTHTDTVTTTVHSASHTPTTTAVAVDASATPLPSSSTAIVTGALDSSAAVAVGGASVDPDTETMATSEGFWMSTNPEPSSPTVSVLKMHADTNGTDVLVTGSSRTLLSTSDVTRSSEPVFSYSSPMYSCVSFTAPAVAVVTSDSASSLSAMSTVPVVVSSHNAPLFSVSESVDATTDSTQVSDLVANGIVEHSDRSSSEGGDLDPDRRDLSTSGSMVGDAPPPTGPAPKKAPPSAAGKSAAVATTTEEQTSVLANGLPGSAGARVSQSSAKRKSEKVTRTPSLRTGRLGAAGKAEKPALSKRSPVVGSRTSSLRTGSTTKPVSVKKLPPRDPVCKSHTPVSTYSSMVQRTESALVGKSKKEESNKPERTGSKLLRKSSSRAQSQGSSSSSSPDELTLGKRGTVRDLKTFTIKDRTSTGKVKLGVLSEDVCRTGRSRSGSQESAHSTSLSQPSRKSTGNKVNSPSSTKSRVVGKVTKPRASLKDAKSTSKEMKALVSSESLPKMDGGTVVTPVVTSSHNSTASSPYSERRYTRVVISDTSESEDEVSLSSQPVQNVSLSTTSLQSLTREVLDIAVVEAAEESLTLETETQVAPHEEELKTLQDSSRLLSNSHKLPSPAAPVEFRSEHPALQQDEALDGQIQNSHVIFKTLATRLHNWKMLGRYLMLEDEDLDRISTEYNFAAEQAYQMLTTWMNKDPPAATYAALIESLQNSLREDLVMEVLQAAKRGQKDLVVQISGDGTLVTFSAELAHFWQRVQPLVDRWTKEGCTRVEVNLHFRK